MNEFNPADYQIPGDNQITLSNELADDLRTRFTKDRRNRFQICLIACGIRRKYLDANTGTYTPDFQKWYKSSKMSELFGSLQNFTKYASAGEVVYYVTSSFTDPERYLNKLPVVIGALYELSIILKQDPDAFFVCMHFTPKRKSIEEPKHEWKTTRPSLISPTVTEQKVRAWRQTWNNPPPPRVKRADKRALPFVTITCSGELLDFDRKTGEKIGCLDLDQVEDFFQKLNSLFGDHNSLQFRIESHIEYLTKAYYSRKKYYDPASRIIEGASKKKRYK